jgi:uncharacterized protein
MVPPVTQSRDLAPDVLRGFALFGIALVNIAYFATDPLLGATGPWLQGWANSLAAYLVWTFGQGKFYLLFAFLFGYSAPYLVRGDPARRGRWYARAGGLILLGVLHVTLLWHGDILFAYGLLALPVGALMFREDASLRRWALATYLLVASLQALLVLGVWMVETEGKTVGALSGTTPLTAILQSGTYVESIPARLSLWASALPSGLLLQGGYAFAMMLLGLLAARSHALRDAGTINPGRLLAWGFGLGLPMQAVSGWLAIGNELGPSPSETVAVAALAVSLTTAPLLSAGYIGGVLWLLQHQPAWVEWLRYPGQMSLSTYLLQSTVLATLFGAWGFGQFQCLPYATAVLIALVTTLVLAGLARLLLSRHPQGPLEWLLSRWTGTLAGGAR